MSDIPDRHPGDNADSGLTPLDIADLPDEQRQVMMSFIRDAAGVLTLDALRDKHDTIGDLPGVLAHLTELNWLIQLGEEPDIRYQVNLRRRRASRLTDKLWAALSSPDSNSGAPPADETTNQHRRRPSLFDW